jgi:hypothetical protein
MLQASRNKIDYEKFYVVKRSEIDAIRKVLQGLEMYAEMISPMDIMTRSEQIAGLLNELQLGEQTEAGLFPRELSKGETLYLIKSRGMDLLTEEEFTEFVTAMDKE